MPLDPVTLPEAVDLVMQSLDEGRGGAVVTPNVEILRQYRRSPELQRAFERTELVVADGTPVVWALRLQGTPIPQRITGSDVLWSLTAAAAARGRSVLLCGGPDGTAARAAARFAGAHPDLHVDAVACDFDRPLAEQLDELATAIVEAAPDVAYLGVPFAGQVHLIEELRPRLTGTWLVGVGSAFDFVNGDRRRAPPWVQRFGLEWAHRLTQQPELWRRYVVQGLPFAGRLGLHVLAARARRVLGGGG